MPAGRRGSAAVRRGRAGTLPAKAVAHKRGTLGNAAAPGLLEMQRSRLVAAATGVIAEYGSATTSVAMICARAGVSRRTYYEIFDNREDCLVAILADAEARAQQAVLDAGAAHGPWRERVRRGLWAILCLFDAEPALARVCLVESQRAAGRVSVERERILVGLATAIDAGAGHGGRGGPVSALTAEALVGAVVAVLAARLGDWPERGGERLTELHKLLGELMAMIVLPYLGAGAARRELERPLPERSSLERPAGQPAAAERGQADHDPLAGRPTRLTYRTARVLQAVAVLGERGALPSNRQIAVHAGVQDQGQISKLLTRLRQHGLLVNASSGADMRGEANSWSLTGAGRRLAHDIGVETDPYRQAGPRERKQRVKAA